MELKEIVLLYNINDDERNNLYKTFFETCQVELKQVSESERAVPLGFLAYGTEEQKSDYMPGKTADDMAGNDAVIDFPPEPMMVFAGFTNQRLTYILSGLREHGLTEASLKAVLTEHNAVWNSATLYEQLAEERERFGRSRDSKE